jgi:hypothetical protein
VAFEPVACPSGLCDLLGGGHFQFVSVRAEAAPQGLERGMEGDAHLRALRFRYLSACRDPQLEKNIMLQTWRDYASYTKDNHHWQMAEAAWREAGLDLWAEAWNLPEESNAGR